MSIPRNPRGSAVQFSVDQQTGEKVAAQARTEHRTERFSEGGAQGGAASAPLAPDGNTGVTSGEMLAETIFSIDWLSFTVHQSKPAIEADLAAVGLDFGFELVPGAAGRGYREIYKGLYGAQLTAAPINEGQVHCGLQFSGAALQALGVEKLVTLRLLASDWQGRGVKVKCTRIDAAFDTRSWAAADIETAMLSGNVEGQFKDWKPTRDYKGLQLVGHTVAFGSRESEAYLRVYDKKDGCSFGDGVPFTRVELELKGRRADAAFWLVLDENPASWSGSFGALLNGYIQVRADWWASFVVTFTSAWHIMGRKVSSVAKKAAWLSHAAARSVAVVLAAKDNAQPGSGRLWLEGVIAKGRRELTKLDAALIRSNEPDGLPRFAVYSLDGAL